MRAEGPLAFHEQTTECILVAEDETNLRNVLLEFSRMEGFDVICAADGREAFPAAREHVPDLVLPDPSQICEHVEKSSQKPACWNSACTTSRRAPKPRN